METENPGAAEKISENCQTTCDDRSSDKILAVLETVVEKVAENETQNIIGGEEVSSKLAQEIEKIVEADEALSNSYETPQQSSNEIKTSSTGGLGLLAQYGSDLDSDSNGEDCNSVVEVVPAGDNNTYRKQNIEIVSDTDTDSSSDSEQILTTLRKEIEKSMQAVDDEDDDEDGADDSKPRKRVPPKVKGELLLDDLPPIEDLQITVPEEECIELGSVHSIVDQLVLVSALPNSMLYDLETVLFLEKGHKVLGEVFDVLGQVSDPLYCVRFNSNQQIKDRDIKIGDVVYCAPKTEYTQFLILSKLMQLRGSDASWENDIEPPPRYLDYSDDEEEREARAQWRNRDRPKESNGATKRTHTETSACDNRASSMPNQARRRMNRQIERNVERDSNGGNPSRNRNCEQQYNYHPSYNSGSWHSNYYHNYHPSVGNYNNPLPPPPHIMHPAYNTPYPYPPPYLMPGYDSRQPMIPPNYPHQMYPQPPVGPPPPPPSS